MAKSSWKKTFWKYLGAMFMEKKDGVQAVSFTRVLASILFIACLVKWSGVLPVDMSTVPPEMVHTLWGLIGIKGLKSTAEAIKGVKE